MQAVVLAAGRANHAVGPERVADEARVVGEQRLHRRRVDVGRRLHDEARRRKLVAGPVRQAACIRVALAGRVVELPDAVALAADLRRALRIQPRRLHDGRRRRRR